MGDHVPEPRAVTRVFAPPFMPKAALPAEPFAGAGLVLGLADVHGDSMSGCALRSWAALGKRRGSWAMPLPHMLASTFAFTPEVHFERAVMAFRCGPEADADGVALCIFADKSAVVLHSKKLDPQNPDAIWAPVPIPLKLSPKITIDGMGFSPRVEQGRLWVGTTAKPIEVAPTAKDLKVGLLYCALVQSAGAWAKAPATRVALDAPIGPDWGTDAQGPWVVPPFLPHSAFTEAEAEAMTAHLGSVAILLRDAFAERARAWHATIQARVRNGQGLTTAAGISIKAMAVGGNTRDAKIEALLKAAWMRGLRHPKAPIPYTRLFGTSLYWPTTTNGKPRRDRLVCHAHVLWQGVKENPDPAHARLAARAALGTSWI